MRTKLEKYECWIGMQNAPNCQRGISSPCQVSERACRHPGAPASHSPAHAAAAPAPVTRLSHPPDFPGGSSSASLNQLARRRPTAVRSVFSRQCGPRSAYLRRGCGGRSRVDCVARVGRCLSVLLWFVAWLCQRVACVCVVRVGVGCGK